MASLSLTHRPYRPREAFDAPPPAVLLLHGLGSNEADLLGLAPYLDPRCFVLSLRAPASLFPGAYAWFHMGLNDAGWSYDPAEVEESRQMLLRFREEAVSTYDLDPARVYLMGFSQGAAMSLLLARTAPKQWAGVAALSGALFPEAEAKLSEPGELDGLPVLAMHGTQDGVVPVSLGRALRDRLTRLPVRLTYHEYPMAHEISPDSLNDLSRWLAERLDETG